MDNPFASPRHGAPADRFSGRLLLSSARAVGLVALGLVLIVIRDLVVQGQRPSPSEVLRLHYDLLPLVVAAGASELLQVDFWHLRRSAIARLCVALCVASAVCWPLRELEWLPSIGKDQVFDHPELIRFTLQTAAIVVLFVLFRWLHSLIVRRK